MLGHIAYLLGMAARLPLQLADQTTKAKTMTIQSTRITRLMNTIMLAVAVFTACALAGCSTYSKVSEKRPRYQPLGVATGAVTKAEAEIVEALRRERRDPLAALGGYLTAAETASHQLQRNPRDRRAQHEYNFAVARIVATIREAKLDPWTQPLRVPARRRRISCSRTGPTRARNGIRRSTISRRRISSTSTALTSASDTRKEGLGAPIVAIGREMNKEARTNFSLPRIYYGVTAVIRFEGRRAVVAFEDPLATETVQLDGQTFPLAADFTVPLAVMLASTNPKKLELTRLLRPAKYAETARIVAAPALRPEQDGRARHSRPDGYARDVDADAQSSARRRGDPAQLPVLVLQLPERLSVSLFRRDPAARTRRHRKALSAAQADGRHRPQHGRLHQPAADHGYRRQALDGDVQQAAGASARSRRTAGSC